MAVGRWMMLYVQDRCLQQLDQVDVVESKVTVDDGEGSTGSLSSIDSFITAFLPMLMPSIQPRLIS
ncbi:hypothetical protein ACXX9E_29680 [Pseudomonas sp. GNP014]